jgi:hypothetical protein
VHTIKCGKEPGYENRAKVIIYKKGSYLNYFILCDEKNIQEIMTILKEYYHFSEAELSIARPVLQEAWDKWVDPQPEVQIKYETFNSKSKTKCQFIEGNFVGSVSCCGFKGSNTKPCDNFISMDEKQCIVTCKGKPIEVNVESKSIKIKFETDPLGNCLTLCPYYIGRYVSSWECFACPRFGGYNKNEKFVECEVVAENEQKNN